MSTKYKYLEQLESGETTPEKLARIKYYCKINEDMKRFLAIAVAIETFNYNKFHGVYNKE